MTFGLLLSMGVFIAVVFGCDNKPPTPQKARLIYKKVSTSKPRENPAAKPALQAPTQQSKPAATADAHPAAKPPKAPISFSESAPSGDSPLALTVTSILGMGGPGEPTGVEKAVYNPEDRIDPFKPLFVEEPARKAALKSAAKKRTRPLTPLEKLDLSQLKLVAVIRSVPKGNTALIEEASGKGYIVKKGTPIGIHSGRVIDILQDRIIVEEELQNIQGDPIIQHRELRLPKYSGEE